MTKMKMRMGTAVGCLALALTVLGGSGFAQGQAAAVSQKAKTSTASTQKNQSATSQTEPIPQRVAAAAIPANIAFTSNGDLWLMDGRNPGAKPKQVTKTGIIEIVGWSANGEWLLYLQHSEKIIYGSPAYLWAVKADGTGAFQVEKKPLRGKPKWSPNDTTIAYLTENSKDPIRSNLFLCKLEKGKVTSVTNPTGEISISDFAWLPEGRGLLVSTPAAKEQPIKLMKVDVSGHTGKSYLIGEKPNVDDGIYWYQADGLTLSPDGRYVAFFVRPNSASISADGVDIRIMDLLMPSRQAVIDGGLGYPEWFAWSPDSHRLAYIAGGNREATTDKSLAIADTTLQFKVTDAGQKDFTDSQPIWSNPDGSKLYYTHGKSNIAWLGKYNPQTVLVPGQRIWERTLDGKQQQVTQGSAQTADYYPDISRDGKTLLFVRLDGAEHGSLYLKFTGNGKEIELLRNLTGEAGYYGNYLPKWVSVYWFKQ